MGIISVYRKIRRPLPGGLPSIRVLLSGIPVILPLTLLLTGCLFLGGSFFSGSAQAQTASSQGPRAAGQGAQGNTRSSVLSRAEKKEFQKRQDSLKVFAGQLVFAENPATRLRADSQFIRILVRALKLKNSFYFPFDSLLTISRLCPPDSSFRIMTWQYKKDEYTYLQEGAIQIRQPDGSLKLYPLFDVSMFTTKPEDSVRTPRNWIGAVYYRIIQKSYRGQNFYTLLGFDDFSMSSNKKWMEVLHFNERNEPLFGGDYISYKEDTAKTADQYRFNIEYKKEAVTTFNYDPSLDMIIYDHLLSEEDEPTRKDTYIPDGDYEGFAWKNGQWVHVEKVFHYKLKEGEFPMDEKMLDESGNANEEKLMEQSQKNQQKKKKP